MFDTAGAAVFAIAVDSVTADVACTEPESTRPPTATSSPSRYGSGPARTSTVVGGEPAVRAADFRLLADRTASPSPTASPRRHLPARRRGVPGRPDPADQELAGVVVLEVPATTGTLVFAPGFLTVGAEWQYGPTAAG